MRDLLIWARPSAEVSTAALARLGYEPALRAEGKTDADGVFEIRGLSAGETYAVSIQSDEWRLLRAEKPWTPEAIRAPASNVVVVVQPISYARFRIVDAATKLPVTGRLLAVSGFGADGKGASVHVLSEQSELSLTPAPLAALASRYSDSYILLVDGVTGSSALVDLSLTVPEYKRAWSRVGLRSLASLLASDAADEVALEREEQGARGSIEADCTRPPIPGLRRAPTMLLQLTKPDSTAAGTGGITIRAGPPPLVYRGRVIRSDSWSFENLPIGDWSARVWDGISWSASEMVAIEPERASQLRTIWKDPTGLSITITDEEGHRVFGAAIFYKSKEHTVVPGAVRLSLNVEGVAPTNASVPVTSDAAAPGPGWLELQPGTYDIRIERRGFEGATVSVDVLAGRATDLRLVLNRARKE